MILPLGNRVIYALVDPRDGVVRYVGVTDNPQLRLREHLQRKRKSSVKLAIWLEDLAKVKLVPCFVFLDSIKTDTSYRVESEWIAHFEAISPLYNHKKR